MSLRRGRLQEPMASPEEDLYEISMLEEQTAPYQLQAPRTKALHIDGWMQLEPQRPPPRLTQTAHPKLHPTPTQHPKPSKQPTPIEPLKPTPKQQPPRTPATLPFRRAHSQQLTRQPPEQPKAKQQTITSFYIRKTQGRSCTKLSEQYYLDHQKMQLQITAYPITPINPEKKRPLRPQVGRIRQLLHLHR